MGNLYESVVLSEVETNAKSTVAASNYGPKDKKLPLKDKIMMGPLDKYQTYSIIITHKNCRSLSLEVLDPHFVGNNDHNIDIAAEHIRRQALPYPLTSLLQAIPERRFLHGYWHGAIPA
jgi:hypothetical protein